MKMIDHVHMMRLIRRASAGGAKRITSTIFEWSIQGDCLNPHRTEFKSRPEGKLVVVSKGKPHTLHLDLFTRCRKCEKCRNQRRRLWYARARSEINQVQRTWFGTLTANPDNQHLWLAAARQAETNAGKSFEEYSREKRFRLHAGEGSKEITRYLKRLRKNGAALRYLCVTEAHKSGMPHWHILMHEVDENKPLLWATLANQWQVGFCKYNLIKGPEHAGYIAKYLGKSAQARVRASRDYGADRTAPLALTHR